MLMMTFLTKWQPFFDTESFVIALHQFDNPLGDSLTWVWTYAWYSLKMARLGLDDSFKTVHIGFTTQSLGSVVLLAMFLFLLTASALTKSFQSAVSMTSVHFVIKGCKSKYFLWEFSLFQIVWIEFFENFTCSELLSIQIIMFIQNLHVAAR